MGRMSGLPERITRHSVGRRGTMSFFSTPTPSSRKISRVIVSLFQGTAGVGGLGVRMLDGSGRFLKESRRGFPSPWVAFCRLSGLSALFPHSRFFSTYYLGHLRPDKAHPAPVLSGACLWISRAILA